jgi:hypothetical protein
MGSAIGASSSATDRSASEADAFCGLSLVDAGTVNAAAAGIMAKVKYHQYFI